MRRWAQLPVGRRRGIAPLHQLLDAVGDALGWLAQLPDGPVGGVPFGDVVGPGVVHQPLGQRRRQHQVAFGDGDEGIAQTVIPEPRAAGLADCPFHLFHRASQRRLGLPARTSF